MKIAYIYLCHKDPLLLRRFADQINYAEDHIFVHVDRKSDIEPFKKACCDCGNVTFIEKRIPNYWGGWNSIVATMNTISCALGKGHYDRYILIQGQDYPLHSPGRIHEFLELHSGEEFCIGVDITDSNDIGDYMKVCGYYIYDFNKSNLFLYFLSNALAVFNGFGLRYRSSVYKENGTVWHIFHGWAQWCLTEEAVEYVLNFYQTKPLFNKFIKHRFPPDELYFATVIHNSSYRKRLAKYDIISREGKLTKMNLTYFEYPSTVVEFTEAAQLQSLLNTNALFVRKVSTANSSELIDAIDRSILEEER